MRIADEWFQCQDGVVRPTIHAHVHGIAGLVRRERFLIDTGADSTVFSADFFHRLRIAGDLPASGLGLVGVGGGAAFVLVRTVLELVRNDGRPVTIRGEFAAFTDPRTIDMSILGRDVLDNFDLIVSRRRDEVLLLAPTHQYEVSRM